MMLTNRSAYAWAVLCPLLTFVVSCSLCLFTTAHNAFAQNYTDWTQPYAVDANTVALYHFNGSAVDAVGNHNGSLQGTVGFVPGRFDQALSTTSGGYVRLGNVNRNPNRSTGQGTVELWANPTVIPDDYFHVLVASGLEFGGYFDDGFFLGEHTGYYGSKNLLFGIWDGSNWQFADSGVPASGLAGSWHHFAGTWGPRGVEIWIDGVLRGTNPYTNGLSNPNYQTVLVGTDSWKQSIAGFYDELRISDIQRTFAPALTYTVTNLGTLGGDYSEATSLNNTGQVVGISLLGDNKTYHAFLWQQGMMTDLGTLGGSTSYAEGINDNGQIIGFASLPGDTVTQAFLWQNKIMTNLGGQASFSEANAINNKGQIAGEIDLRAVFWQQGSVTYINPVSDRIYGTALGINNSGQIVGVTNNFANGFLWQNGVTTLLNTLGGAESVAWASNNNQIVGWSTLPGDTVFHAVLWDNGNINDLGTLGGPSSYAYGINTHGDIVGVSDTGTDSHLFLWQNGVMQDLNDLIPPDSGWVLNVQGLDGPSDKFVAINNVGQIAGIGSYHGHTRAFLLTPAGNGVQGPPVLITNVTAANLSLTGATISWNTNVPADSTIEYGYTDSYGQTSSSPALVTNHSITLNLLPDRIYHYRVTSTAANGQSATSADQTFVTVAGPDFYMSYANLHKDPYGRYLVDLTFTNQGGADIPEIEVYGATLGNATPLAPNLPLPKFGLTTNASYTVTVTFPGTAGSSGASVPLEIGTALYDGFGNLLGYVAFNYLRITLP